MLQLVFFLTQLVQLLRGDTGETVLLFPGLVFPSPCNPHVTPSFLHGAPCTVTEALLLMLNKLLKVYQFFV